MKKQSKILIGKNISAYEKFKKLGYKRKQNNKQYIQYLLIDENYFNINGIHNKNSKVERYITFNKKHNTIELKELCYTFNVARKKRILYISSFVINEELLNAINEQFLEIKNELKVI